MTENEEFLQCYNKGCGLKFKGNENNEESCCFHPGAPVFHDAYKGWSCCNKKSTDFTTFLNMKGCTQGKHNPIKPEEPIRHKPDPATKDEVITVCSPKPVAMERPDFNLKLEKLKVVTSQSLKDALNKDKENEKIEDEDDLSLGIKIGESCKNNGCQATYEGEHSNLSLCKYHPGFPIFHEGMKYWYCCQRKTSDFDVFLQQEGCTTGSHNWTKKNLKKAMCRYDWHQTGTHVVVTVYSKLSQPDLSNIEANPIRLNFHIAFGDDQEFTQDHELGGVIVPKESSVLMAPTKVEIKLKKAEPKHWNKIFVVQKREADVVVNDKKLGSKETDPDLSVDAIDLSDI